MLAFAVAFMLAGLAINQAGDCVTGLICALVSLVALDVWIFKFEKQSRTL